MIWEELSGEKKWGERGETHRKRRDRRETERDRD